MIRAFLIWLSLLVAGPCFADNPPVIVKTELTAESVTVGQPLIFRVTILVPTWMSEPPRFPTMEMPNVIVRLPSRSTSPVSERINGETWSGVSRAYHLFPMIPGEFSFAPNPIAVTFAEPDTRTPTKIDVTLEAVNFTAVVPEAAKGLNPLIVAEEFSLSQTFEGGDSPLGAGDAVTRTVIAKIQGTSALFIPPLVEPTSLDNVRSYPKDPVVEESENRGQLSGSRTETVSFVATHGGTFELPAVSLDWYNIETKKIETAILEGSSYEIDAPLPAEDPFMTPRQIAIATCIIFGLGLTFWVVKRYVFPPLRRRLAERSTIWLASEAYAARRVKRAIGSHDLSLVYSAMVVWSSRCPGKPGPGLETALALVGQARFRDDEPNSRNWAILSAEFQKDRDRRMATKFRNPLPPLNVA